MKTLKTLILCIAAIAASTQYAAAETTAVAPSNGNGEAATPYEIATLANLKWLSVTSTVWNKQFIQTADIDAYETRTWNGGAGFIPIGGNTNAYPATNPFTGTYNGKGHIISNLYINRTVSNIGLFGYINSSAARVDSLGMVNANITGQGAVGGLVGHIGTTNFGGTISNSYSTGTVSGNSNIGGLAGLIENGSISNSYSMCTLSTPAGGIGGLVGSFDRGSLTKSYFAGTVLTNGTGVGGLIGVRQNTATLNNNYYDRETSGLQYAIGTIGSNPAGAQPRTTAEMWVRDTFVNASWDFTNIWTIRDGKSYPYFASQSAPVYVNYCNIEELNIDLLNTADSVVVYNSSNVRIAKLQTPNATSGSSKIIPLSGVSANDTIYIVTYEHGKAPSYPVRAIVKPLFCGGSGTAADPYKICDLEALKYLSEHSAYWSAGVYFIQTADIDASQTKTGGSGYAANGAGFSPIGGMNAASAFKGNYNAKGHTISNLFINRSERNTIGLFGYNEGVIDSLAMVNANITCPHTFVGGLVGINYGTIANSYFTGTVSSSANNNVGGLVGDNYGTITNCYSIGTVSAANGSFVGGLVGTNTIGGTITNSYSMSTVFADGPCVGGLVGTNTLGGTITNSYSTGTVSVNGVDSHNAYVGGLIGYNTDNAGTITNNYYDSQTSGRQYAMGGNSSTNGSNSAGGAEPRPTAEMWRQVTTYNNWTFGSNPWLIRNDSSYAYFGYQSAPVYVNNCNIEELNIDLLNTADSVVVYNSSNVRIAKLQTPNATSGSSKIIPLSGVSANDTIYIVTYEQGKAPSYPVQTIVKPLFCGGNGTVDDPYQICNLEALKYLSERSAYWGAGIHFIQTADIDAYETRTWNGGAGFSPIGNNGTKFTGTYNGNKHTISNLYINRPNQDYIGLFGFASTTSLASVDNLGMVNVDIKGKDYVGGLIGNKINSTISNSYSTGVVSGNGLCQYVGGLVGSSTGSGTTITNCYSTCAVSGQYNIGGLVGYHNTGTMSNCYSTGTVSVFNKTLAHSFIGGLIGRNTGTISNNYYDSQTSGQQYALGGNSGILSGNNPAGAQPRTTAEMWQQTTTYNTWTFGSNSWLIRNDSSYAYFGWQSAPVYVQNRTATTLTINLLHPADSVIIYNQTTGSTTKYGTKPAGNNTVALTAAAITDILYITTYKAGKAPSYAVRDVNPICGGSGTVGDPYQICNLEALKYLSEHSAYWGAGVHFIQTADINAYETRTWNYNVDHYEGFSPIGNNGTKFYGTYNGNKHAISNLYINRPNQNYIGLFGYIYNPAVINSLAMVNANITGYNTVGGLVGRNYYSTITNSYSSGTVSGNTLVGGLVGDYTASSTFGTLFNNYSTGTVSSIGSAGGLVGSAHGGPISNNYSTGTVVSVDHSGGLIGYYSSGTLSNNYYDRETSGKQYAIGTTPSIITGINPAGAQPRTTAEMWQQATTYNNWTFGSDSWLIRNDSSYAYFGWQSAPVYVQSRTATALTINLLHPADSVIIYNQTTGSTTKYGTIPAGGNTVALTAALADTLYITTYKAGKAPSYPVQAVVKASFCGGAGTVADPYKICNLEQLQYLSEHPTFWDKHFVQTANINAAPTALATYGNGSGKGFSPIGNMTNKFTGTYNGKGHVVSNLYINRGENVTGNTCTGLFGYLYSPANAADSSWVDSLGVVDANITGRQYVGALAGHVDSSSKITNSYAAGGTVTGTTLMSGGLVGYINTGGRVSNSYAMVRMQGTANVVGGLVGAVRASTSIVSNSYSTGAVAMASSSTPLGGLVGSNADGPGTILHSYYDNITSGQNDEGKGEPEPTLDMWQQTNYNNWNFGNGNPWRIRNDSSYAYLGWQSAPVYVQSRSVGNIYIHLLRAVDSIIIINKNKPISISPPNPLKIIAAGIVNSGGVKSIVIPNSAPITDTLYITTYETGKAPSYPVPGFVVTPDTITVKPSNISKVYDSGDDPAIPFTLTDNGGHSLYGSILSRTFGREAGETVGEYRLTFNPDEWTFTNHVFKFDTAGVRFSITPKPVTITGLSVSNKTYDGTTAATVIGTAVITGKVTSDVVNVVTVTGTAAANFDTKDKGEGKTVTFTNYSLDGDDAYNYTLSAQPANVTASIFAKTLTINTSAATVAQKTYNGDATATVIGVTLDGEVQDEVLASPADFDWTAEFDNPNAGIGNKTVTVTVTLKTTTSTLASNYTLPVTTAVIANQTIDYLSQGTPVITQGASLTKTYGENAFTLDVSGGAGTGNYEWRSENEAVATVTNTGTGSSTTVSIHGANYTIIYVKKLGDADYAESAEASLTLTVDPKMLTVKADNKVKRQGANNPPLTFTYSGFVYGDTAEDLDTEPVFVTDAEKESTANTYEIYVYSPGSTTLAPGAVLGLSNNYNFYYEVGYLKVDPKLNGLVAWGNTTFVYNGTAQVPTATVDIYGASILVDTAKTEAGTYTAYARFAQPNDTSTLLNASVQFTIVPDTVKVMANAISKVYNGAGADPELTYTKSKNLYEAPGNAFTGSLSRAEGKDVIGSPYYAITQGTLTAGNNYHIDFTGAQFEIKKATLTVTADDKTLRQGTLNPVFTVSYSGFVSPDNESNSLTTLPTAGTTVDISNSLGIFLDTIKASGGVSGNYEFAYRPGTLEITGKRAENVQWNNLLFTYDGSAHVPEAFIDIDGSIVNLYVDTLKTNAGTYTAVASFVTNIDTIALSGYTHLFTIVPDTITVTPLAASKIYGSNDPVLTYNVSKTLVTGNDFDGVLSRTSGNTVAGSPYDITPGSLSAGNNYYIKFALGAQFTITKAPLTVTADNKTKTEGAPMPALTVTYSGFVGSEDENILTFTKPDVSTTATKDSPAGNYAITVANAASPNYDIAQVDGTLIVNPKRSINVVWDSLQFTYDGEAHKPAAKVTIDGTEVKLAVSPAQTNAGINYPATASFNPANDTVVLSGASTQFTIVPDTVIVTALAASKIYGSNDPALTYNSDKTVAFTGALSRNTGNTVAGSPYAINKGGLSAGNNYYIKFVGANFTIDPKPLTVKADPKIKRQGADNPTLTVSYTGFVTGEDAANNLTTQPQLTTTAVKGSSVGKYPITLAQPAVSAYNNYDITYVPDTLTIINKRTENVVWSNTSLVYNGSAQKPEATVTINGTVVTLTVDTAKTNAGTYMAYARFVPANDTVELENPIAPFTIAKAAGTFLPHDDIHFTYYTGLMISHLPLPSAYVWNTVDGSLFVQADGNGEAIAVIYTDPSGNYEPATGFIRVYIDPAVGTASVTLANWIYGALNANEPVVASATNGTANVTFMYDSIVGTTYHSAVQPKNVGRYRVTAIFAATTNYSQLTASAEFQIDKKQLMVNADNKTRTQGAANPTFTVTYSGWEYNDDESCLTVTPQPITDAVKESPVGSDYKIYWLDATNNLVSGAIPGQAANYKFDYQTAFLTITPKHSLAVEWGNTSFVYNGSAQKPTATVNLQNGTIIDLAVDTAKTNVGTYTAYARFSDADANANDTIILTNTSVQFTINKADYVGITHPVLTAVYTSTNTLSDVSGLQSNFSWVDGSTKLTVAQSTYPAKYNADPANYNDFSLDITVNVTPSSGSSATVSLNNWTYGSVPNTPVVNSTTHSTTTGVSYMYENITGSTYQSATPPKNAGNYKVTATFAANDNYQQTEATANFTINKKTLTVTADNKTKTQGANNPPLTITYAGWEYGEDKSSLTLEPTIWTDAEKESIKSDYDIYVDGGESGNYDFEYHGGYLIVTERHSLAVNWDNSTTSFVYNGLPQKPTATVTLDNGTTVTLAVDTAKIDVGNYKAYAYFSPANDTTVLTDTTVLFNITPRGLTLQALEQTVRKDNSVKPAALGTTYKYEGLVGSDNVGITVALSCTQSTSSIGTYPKAIVPVASGTLNRNYTLALDSGTLIVIDSKVAITYLSGAQSTAANEVDSVMLGDIHTVRPANTFTANAPYVFQWWSDNGNTYYPGSTFTVSEPLTLTAIWRDTTGTVPGGSKVAITYKKGDHGIGNDVIDSVYYGVDAIVRGSNTFVADAPYVFKWWSNGGVTYYPDSAIKDVTAPLTLTAIWLDTTGTSEAEDDIKNGLDSKIAITYQPGNYGIGNAIIDSVLPGVDAIVRGSNTFAGVAPYVFQWWSDNGVSYYPDSAIKDVTAPLTLTAIWLDTTGTGKAIDDINKGLGSKIAITYNKGAHGIGADVIDSVYYGVDAIVRGSNTFAGAVPYVFQWWSDNGVSYYPDSAIKDVTVALTLTAIWLDTTGTGKAIDDINKGLGSKIAITYNKGAHGIGADVIDSVYYGVDAIVRGSNTFAGAVPYVFKWWSNGGVTYYPDSAIKDVTVALTLTAIWLDTTGTGKAIDDINKGLGSKIAITYNKGAHGIGADVIDSVYYGVDAIVRGSNTFAGAVPYVFQWWSNGGVTYYPDSAIKDVTVALTLTAIWLDTTGTGKAIDDINKGLGSKIAITYNKGAHGIGADVIDSVYYGVDAIVRGSNTFAGAVPYVFKWWSNGGVTYYPDSAIKDVTVALTLTAIWLDTTGTGKAIDDINKGLGSKIAITYNKGAHGIGADVIDSVYYGVDAIVRGSNTFAGAVPYVFKWWSDAKSNTYYPDSAIKDVTVALTLTAIWVDTIGTGKAIDDIKNGFATKLAITYQPGNYGNGSAIIDSVLPNVDAIVLGANTFTAPAPYVFEWWSDDDGNSYHPNDVLPKVSAALTLTAIWVDTTNTYEAEKNIEQGLAAKIAITYQPGTHGIGSAIIDSVLPNVNATVLGANTFKGIAPYKFHWWSDGINTYYPNEALEKVSAPLTLTAIWLDTTGIDEAIKTNAPKHAVTYLAGEHGSGATVIDSVYHNTNTIIRGGNTFTADGNYVFQKWSDGTNDYAPNDALNNVIAPLTLTAIWEIIAQSDVTNSSVGSINGAHYESTLSRWVIDCDNTNDFVTVTVGVADSSATVYYNDAICPDRTFIVSIPKPDIYTVTYTVVAGDGVTSETTTFELELRFVFDSIGGQKWDNVLYVNNNPRNNGGYKFDAYQWYKDDVALAGQTGQYYSAGKTKYDLLVADALYHVEVTYDGKTLRSCPDVMRMEASAGLLVYPNPVQGNQLNVEDAAVQAGDDIAIYSITGNLVKVYAAQGGITQLTLPNLSSGVYIVKVKNRDAKIVVK